MHWVYRGLGPAVTLLLLSACNYYEPKGQVFESDRPNFTVVTASFFQPYCLRCHQGERAAMGIDLGDYEGLVEDGWLVPGAPQESLIYAVVEGGSMPPFGLMPEPEQIELLRAWIASGAPRE